MKRNKNRKAEEHEDPIEGAFIFRHQHKWSIVKIAGHYAVDVRTIRRWLALYKDKTSRYWTKKRCTRVRQKRHGPEIIEKIRQLKVAVPARTAVTIYRLLKADLKTAFPSKETIRRVLKRLGFSRDASPGRKSYVKFERDFPNELWHIDFKGYEFFEHLGKLYLLAIMDDRSRYIIAAHWCTDQEETSVLLLLREAFEKWGLPNEILSDNGSQFKNMIGEPATRYYRLLVKLDVQPVYHRPNHPQTKGKLERWFGTVMSSYFPDARALVASKPTMTLKELNDHFAAWLEWYNTQHEHSSLDGKPPAVVYLDHPKRIHRPLIITFNWDAWLAIIESRKVTKQNMISVDGAKYILPEGYAGTNVQIRKYHDKIEVYSNEVLVETFHRGTEAETGSFPVIRVVAKNGTFKYKRKVYTIGYKHAHKILTVQEAANGKELLLYHDGELLARVNICDGMDY